MLCRIGRNHLRVLKREFVPSTMVFGLKRLLRIGVCMVLEVSKIPFGLLTDVARGFPKRAVPSPDVKLLGNS